MKGSICASIFPFLFSISALSQTMDEMSRDNRSSEKEHSNIKWFKEAKFGMFIHWGALFEDWQENGKGKILRQWRMDHELPWARSP